MKTIEELEMALKLLINDESFSGGDEMLKNIETLRTGIKEQQEIIELLMLATAIIIKAVNPEALQDEDTRNVTISFINQSRKMLGDRQPITTEQ